jgi:hypothetical protein
MYTKVDELTHMYNNMERMQLEYEVEYKLKWKYDEIEVSDIIEEHLQNISPELNTDMDELIDKVKDLIKLTENKYTNDPLQQVIEKFQGYDIDNEIDVNFMFSLFLNVYYLDFDRFCKKKKYKKLEGFINKAYLTLKCQKTLEQFYGVPKKKYLN